MLKLENITNSFSNTILNPTSMTAFQFLWLWFQLPFLLFFKYMRCVYFSWSLTSSSWLNLSFQLQIYVFLMLMCLTILLRLFFLIPTLSLLAFIGIFFFVDCTFYIFFASYLCLCHWFCVFGRAWFTFESITSSAHLCCELTRYLSYRLHMSATCAS